MIFTETISLKHNQKRVYYTRHHLLSVCYDISEEVKQINIHKRSNEWTSISAINGKV
jgi:hypothetical protein